MLFVQKCELPINTLHTEHPLITSKIASHHIEAVPTQWVRKLQLQLTLIVVLHKSVNGHFSKVEDGQVPLIDFREFVQQKLVDCAFTLIGSGLEQELVVGEIATDWAVHPQDTLHRS